MMRIRIGFLLVWLALCGNAAAVEVLLPRDEGLWKFHDGGAIAGDAWRSAEFDDESWKLGAGPLGYGDEGMATTISFGDNGGAKHLTSYFRREFDWQAGDARASRLEVLLRCDDGGVVYLNGKEIARQNMPEGKVGGETPAALAIAGVAETTYNRFLLPVGDLFKVGENVLAVEVHQAGPTSSDLVFDLELKLYAEGEEPKVDHYVEGLAAFRAGQFEDGARHFTAISPEDENFKQALQIIVENVYGPNGIDKPKKALAYTKKAYASMPTDMEVVRAFIRSHVLAEEGLTFSLKSRPAPEDVPAEFRFLQNKMPSPDGSGVKVSADDLAADLDYLELMIDNCYSYAERRGVDWKTALDVVRASLGDEGTSVAQLAFTLERFLTLFGDPHTSFRVPPSYYLPGGFAPFLAFPDGDRVFVVEPDRKAFIDAGHPYLKAVDGQPLAEWLTAAGHRVPKASPQYQARALAAELSRIPWLRTELGIDASPKVKLTLENAEGDKETTVELALGDDPSGPGTWPKGKSRRMGEIGYLRIPSMRSTQTHIAALNKRMAEFKDTRGLIIDVRGNGGGSQDTLKTLLPYVMKPDAPLRVVNVAAYRMPIKLSQPNPSGFLGLYGRGLHPVTSKVWKADEKAAISTFLESFDAKWDLPPGKFSAWHAMGIRPSNNPHAYHYQKPVIVLSDSGCFSATDNFLGGFKGVPGVTLIGTASGGGSGRMQSYTLPNSGLPLTLCQMASFQRDGHTYDGHGVVPDVAMAARPQDSLEGGADSVLEAAVRRLNGDAE